MKSKDIIKALECCSLFDSYEECRKCFYAECESEKGCVSELCEDALDLIKNQQAEIEKLKKANERIVINFNIVSKALKTAKIEAYKEFVDKLKEKASKGFWDELAYVDTEQIDDVYEELTEKGGIDNA